MDVTKSSRSLIKGHKSAVLWFTGLSGAGKSTIGLSSMVYARAGCRITGGRVEIDGDRIDDAPRAFSGGMRQRLQIARNLVTHPRLVFMDEPTGGLDVSVQARLLDLLRGLVADLGLSVIIVTHDLAVARLLSHRLMVMRQGRVIETGLTDQVLDDPIGRELDRGPVRVQERREALCELKRQSAELRPSR
jgi:ABC-type glutathione transport system ATPase component